MNKHFIELLDRSRAIHEKKNQDYTTDPTVNEFENFERANLIASWFPDEYKSFATLIGIKIARLAALLSSGRTPNNESIDDTFLDQFTYTGLFYAYYKKLTSVFINPEYCSHTNLNIFEHCKDCNTLIDSKMRQGRYVVNPDQTFSRTSE